MLTVFLFDAVKAAHDASGVCKEKQRFVCSGSLAQAQRCQFARAANDVEVLEVIETFQRVNRKLQEFFRRGLFSTSTTDHALRL